MRRRPPRSPPRSPRQRSRGGHTANLRARAHRLAAVVARRHQPAVHGMRPRALGAVPHADGTIAVVSDGAVLREAARLTEQLRRDAHAAAAHAVARLVAARNTNGPPRRRRRRRAAPPARSAACAPPASTYSEKGEPRTGSPHGRTTHVCAAAARARSVAVSRPSRAAFTCTSAARSPRCRRRWRRVWAPRAPSTRSRWPPSNSRGRRATAARCARLAHPQRLDGRRVVGGRRRPDGKEGRARRRRARVGAAGARRRCVANLGRRHRQGHVQVCSPISRGATSPW